MNRRSHQSRCRVLLVDDHAPLAEATAEFMRGKGFDVRIASTGREALEMAAAFQPEIVLCDIHLPDMPGLDVARALRAIPGVKSAVIAMHTAMAQSSLRSLRDADAPVNLFLSKPITEENIDALISQIRL
jgi:CheY-like chemotaxis protein